MGCKTNAGRDCIRIRFFDPFIRSKGTNCTNILVNWHLGSLMLPGGYKE